MTPKHTEPRERPTLPPSPRKEKSRAFTSVVVSLDVDTGKRIHTRERHHETADLARGVCEKEVRNIKGVATRIKGWGRHWIVFYRDNETKVCVQVWPEEPALSCPG